jgi:precorrin-8X/cobalt-precorrin-8 methylmutase
MSERAAYLPDGTAIYERSFAIIRAEADLSRFSAEEADIAVRMIHACGQVDMARHIVFGGDLVAAARGALAAGAPILCDAEMVAHGITRARLPAKNEVICTLNDSRTAALATQNDPFGGGAGFMARSPRRRGCCHRQCADGFVPAARHD